MDVNEILHLRNPHKALEALEKAKDLCKKGNVIELMDFLCPEDAITYTSSKTGKKIKK